MLFRGWKKNKVKFCRIWVLEPLGWYMTRLNLPFSYSCLRSIHATWCQFLFWFEIKYRVNRWGVSSALIFMPTRREAFWVFSCKAAPPETSVRLEQKCSKHAGCVTKVSAFYQESFFLSLRFKKLLVKIVACPSLAVFDECANVLKASFKTSGVTRI